MKGSITHLRDKAAGSLKLVSLQPRTELWSQLGKNVGRRPLSPIIFKHFTALSFVKQANNA